MSDEFDLNMNLRIHFEKDIKNFLSTVKDLTLFPLLFFYRKQILMPKQMLICKTMRLRPKYYPYKNRLILTVTCILEL